MKKQRGGFTGGEAQRPLCAAGLGDPLEISRAEQSAGRHRNALCAASTIVSHAQESGRAQNSGDATPNEQGRRTVEAK